jgi:hypothetical protein
MTTPSRHQPAGTGDTDQTSGDLDAIAAILAAAAAAIRSDLAEIIVVAELNQHDLDDLMLLGVGDDDTFRMFRQPWRIGAVAPVALSVDGEVLLLAHPDEQEVRRLRCRSGTRLLVRQVTAEALDPDPRTEWRDAIDDAIGAYGDAREAGHGSADALGEIEHLLDQVDGER